MSDPALAVQDAILAALTAAPVVAGGNVYDRVPPNAPTPYIAIGECVETNADTACFESSEIAAQVHVWSTAPGMVEVKEIAAEVRTRCRTLVCEGLVEGRHVVTRYLRDPDGVTTHAVVEFEFFVDH